MQRIDLTGFINEYIELEIDKNIYNIPTDPDMESYVFLLKYLEGKFTAEEYIDIQQKLIISLIVNNNKDKQIDIAKLKAQLGATATEQFMRSYIEILINKGVLKKNPPKEKKSQSN